MHIQVHNYNPHNKCVQEFKILNKCVQVHKIYFKFSLHFVKLLERKYIEFDLLSAVRSLHYPKLLDCNNNRCRLFLIL